MWLLGVILDNISSSTLIQRMFWQRVFAKESESTEDWFIRKPDLTKKSQSVQCLHTKKRSSSYWMH